jgi:hypothetical protein
MLNFKEYLIGLTRHDRIKTLLALHEWVSEQNGSAALEVPMMRLITLYDMCVSDEELVADRVWMDLSALSTSTLYVDMIARFRSPATNGNPLLAE